jgi:cytochrome c nitrite reductase small subunit
MAAAPALSAVGGREGWTAELVLAAAIGLVIGVGGYTFLYAKGSSYLTDNPAACANCHIMRAHFDGWITSSHRAVAVCNDCHTPAGFAAKYATKRAFDSGGHAAID